MTLEKQVFWQDKRALRMTAAAVQREWSSFLVVRSQDAAITSPFEFRIRKPTPTEDLAPRKQGLILPKYIINYVNYA